MISEKYNLNQATLDFVNDYARRVKKGYIISNKELIEIFNKSKYYNEEVETYYPTARSKSLWYAIHRSDVWVKSRRGIYERI